VSPLVLIIAGLGATDGGVSDAGVRFDAALYGSCSEAPPLEPADGGFFMPELRARRLNCLMTTCEVDRREKEHLLVDMPPPPAWWLWASGVTAALVLGAIIGRYWPW